MINICKLCLKNKVLVNSHIFSEFLYKTIYDEKHTFISLSDLSEHKLTKLFQKGFKQYLMCKRCDNTVIQKYENYAIKVLKKINSLTDETVGTVVIDGYDYTKFKLFVLSLIWRCHISNNPAFNRINLGSHAETIRRMLLFCDSGKRSHYCFSISKIFGADNANTVMLPPQKVRLQNQNSCIFLAYGFYWVILLSTSLKEYIREYPVLGYTDKLIVDVHQTTKEDFIQDMLEKMGIDFFNKLKKHHDSKHLAKN